MTDTYEPNGIPVKFMEDKPKSREPIMIIIGYDDDKKAYYLRSKMNAIQFIPDDVALKLLKILKHEDML